MLDMSNTSLMGTGNERISCLPSNLHRGSTITPLMNIFTIDQVLRRQSCLPIDDTLDENFLNVSCIVVDERDPFDDQIRRQILDKRGINYSIMENYSIEKQDLPSILAKNKVGTKIEKVKLGELKEETRKTNENEFVTFD
jgi:DNA-directed RNA polymerase subunit H (RpoH/RPB5)